ncbi:hypothetical protein LVY72_06025 [Arthrobacter sp. I2-34]|uniref:Rubrerythrin diiron-binding domain-containing protein n=1 Tax=Arthrobacter hankyongi TaxID=2904801 RepID=A0ABS9L490_9MICC|nr:hypothetical protein [Arthrobacter hankyongi]MCG2621473.1 hypothetical protein [Arthrobacter hankyongi]
MGFEQYHEPAGELSAETRTFARMCANLTEEAEAIGWYEQRISLERDPAARAIMLDSLAEEYKHFSMELEYLFRAKPQWREIARGILFQDGDIVANGEAAESAAASGTESEQPASPGASLGIGSLKEQNQ